MKAEIILIFLVLYLLGLIFIVIPKVNEARTEFCQEQGFEEYYDFECRTVKNEAIAFAEVECTDPINMLLIFSEPQEKCWIKEERK